jgi:hypothetical protein
MAQPNFVPISTVTVHKCKKARKITALETLLVAIADRLDAIEKDLAEIKCKTTGDCKEAPESNKVRNAVLSYLNLTKDEDEEY